MAIAFDTPEYWLMRAEEARAIANQIDDAEAKEAMLAVAESYEKLATRAEKRLAGEGAGERE